MTISKIRLDVIGIALIMTMLFFEVLSSPIRYYSSLIGLGALYYTPKLLLLIFAALKLLVTNRPNKWLFILFLSAEIAYGALNNGVLSSLFSFYTWTPLWAFFFLDKKFFTNKSFEKIIKYIFYISVFGVLLETIVDFPWVGFELEILGTSIEGNREWWSQGISRLSGFTRISANTAIIIMIASVYTLYGCKISLHKVILYILSLLCLILTTNKAAIGAYIVLTPFIFGLKSISISLFYLFFLFSMNALLLVSSIGFSFSVDNPKTIIEIFLLRSFDIRLEETWPIFYETLTNNPNYATSFFGTGFGGVGTVIKNFGNVANSSLATADNSALYIYGLFGFFGIVMYLYLYKLCANLLVSEEPYRLKLGFSLLSCLIVGITTDIFEYVIILTLIGFVIHRERNKIV